MCISFIQYLELYMHYYFINQFKKELHKKEPFGVINVGEQITKQSSSKLCQSDSHHNTKHVCVHEINIAMKICCLRCADKKQT